MFNRHQQSLKSRKKLSGFSLVELLVVIGVIGILVSLRTTVYASMSGRSYDVSVQNDLANIAKKVKLYHAEHGLYPAGSTQLAQLGIKVSKSAYGNHYSVGASNYNLLYCRTPATAPISFAIVAYSQSGAGFQYSGGGELSRYTGPKTGVGQMCTSAGVTSSGASNERDWLYNNNTWWSYVSG